MTGPSSLFSFLGTWELSREICHADGRIDRLQGSCAFTRSGPHLLQDEWGLLETSAGQFRATRRYVWKEAEGQLNVFFQDMRPFHSVQLGVERPETIHLCAPDRYAVVYDFTRWPNWFTCLLYTSPSPRDA